MTEHDQIAEFLRLVKAEGIDIGQCCVLPQGVFFGSEKTARIFAERHQKDVVPISGQVSGWLAKNKT